ncbi:hypothetical protein [Nitrososphaera sp.]|uniref:hypothetical protein n=1 Tax=Nitrososphaera sp. TaxID=1971748 RepID=UPI00307DD7FF
MAKGSKKKRATSPNPKKKGSHGNSLHLSKEDRQMIANIATGKIKSTTYDGEEYLARIRAMIDEPAA